MKEKLNKHAGAILGILLIIATLSILSILGGAIMKIFGFKYDSIKSIVLFFITSAALAFPIEGLAKSLPKALLSLGKINVMMAKIIFFILDTIVTMSSMMIVDYFMESISATKISILVISMVIAILDINDIKEKQ